MKKTDLNKTPLLKALFYGDSGAGKTTLVGTCMECEDTYPLLVLNAGGQPISLRHLDPPPLVLDVEKIEDFNLIYDWLYRGQKFREATHLSNNDVQVYGLLRDYLEEVGAPKFNAITIDSITHVQRLAMESVVGGTMPAKPAEVPTQTQIQHWGRTLALMTNFADRFYKLPIHVLMTALTRRDHIEAFGYTLFCPFLWGQSNMEIPSHAEVVGRLMPTATIPIKDRKALTARLNGGEAYNVLYLRGGKDFIAKWQGPANPPGAVVAPTIQKLIDVLAVTPPRRGGGVQTKTNTNTNTGG